MHGRLIRVLFGFIAANLVVGLTASLLALLYAVFASGYGVINSLSAMWSGDSNFWYFAHYVVGTAVVVAFLLSIIISSFVGIPLYLFVLRHRHASLRSYTMLGFLISVITIMVILALHVTGGFLVREDLILAICIVLVAGPAASVTFWIIVRPHYGNQ